MLMKIGQGRPGTATSVAGGYRGDVDGLRALAVVGVVAFHAGLPGLSGGFAGVDVFFVISGYLIGGIVQREVAAGQFSFADFYLRRARRILPALIATALLTLALGLLLLGPGELARFATSAAAALVGLSNLWFFHATDYFNPDARLEPFLMTWSLGIEEQFYVLLPPLLLAVHRWRGRALAWVAAGTAASLLLGLVATPLRPVEAFYLLPTRAWELGIGVALALAQAEGWRLPARAQAAASVAGAAAVLAAFLLFDDRVRFPGAAALLPTVGAALIVAAPDAALNRRLLASRPAVAVGLLSYSWYLLHWPLLALLSICAAGPVPAAWSAAVGFGAILPAWAMWRWVERPFRHPAPRRSRRAALTGYAVATGACVALLLGVVVSGGIPARVGAAGARAEAVLARSRGGPCLAGYGTAAPNFAPPCAPGGDRPLVALLGDSHAAALAGALRERGAREGFAVLQMTAGSCPPLLGATLTMLRHPGASRACADYNAAAIARAADDPRVALVVLTGLWQSTFGEAAVAAGERVIDADPRVAGRTGAEELRIALERTLVRLRAGGKPVLLLGDVPWLRFDPALHVWSTLLPARAALERRITPGLGAVVDRHFVDPLDDRGNRIAAAAGAAVPGVRMVALRGLLCDARGCRTADATGPFFIDPQHLSDAGAAYVLSRVPLPVSGS